MVGYQFVGLTVRDLDNVSCVFCGKRLMEKQGAVVRIVEYADKFCREELRSLFAHDVCVVTAIQIFRDTVGGEEENGSCL